jgi:hypothetical protein
LPRSNDQAGTTNDPASLRAGGNTTLQTAAHATASTTNANPRHRRNRYDSILIASFPRKSGLTAPANPLGQHSFKQNRP